MIGYLKRVTRIDTCRSHESITEPSLPEMRFISSPTVTSVNMNRIKKSDDDISSCQFQFNPPSSIKFRLNNNEYESESEAEENMIKRNSSETPSGRRHHLLPSSFLGRLPPGTPGPSRSGRSSCSSGFKSGQSRPESVSDDCVSEMKNVKRPICDHHYNDREQFRREHQRTRTHHSKSSSTPTATTPTTFCPTIASALWRPLWPPGENTTTP